METRFTKSNYKIREAAEIIGVPQTTLRYWEQEFSDLKPRRSLHNQRYYSKSDMELLEIIHYLLHIKGLKMEAAKEYLHHNRKNISRKFEIIRKLEMIKTDLETMLRALNLRK